LSAEVTQGEAFLKTQGFDGFVEHRTLLFLW
jgi:hypothetical protein